MDNELPISIGTVPFALVAFEACATKAKTLGRRLYRDEWLETVQQAYDSYQPASKPTPRRTPKAADEDWIAELEANEAYQGIDIRRELGKAQAWASVKGVGVSRQRFINWLNKVDRPVAINGAGQTSFQKAVAPVYEPPGWRDWVRENATNPDWANQPWSVLDPAAQKYILSQLNATETPRPKEVPRQDDAGGSEGDAPTLLERRALQGDRGQVRDLASILLANL